VRLDAFRGHWRLARTIEDLRARRSGRLEGRARFVPDGEGLAYFEEGTLRYPGAPPMAATRRYLWREGAGGCIELRFEDGRFFHRFDAEEARPSAEHLCSPDRYRVCYDFTRWPRWRAEWRVEGPRKDYALVSAYRPAAGA
jgi:Family of unknown function (DUF6314)